MTLSYDGDYDLSWVMIQKNKICGIGNDFSSSIWQEQVNHILSFEKYSINESKFPGTTGNTWDDYKEHMNGKGDNSLITTNDGIMVSYDPEIYLFYVAKDEILAE